MQYFILNQAQTIRLPKETDTEVLAELLSNYTYGAEWKLSCDSEAPCITVGDYEKAELGDFAYVMNITADGIYICGRDDSEIIHGFIDLLNRIQYVKEKDAFAVVCGKIYEKPKIAFRGVHLCLFPETKLDFIKKCVRTCGLVKYSHVILEFWGMLKFDCMKELAWPFAYTKDQIKEIVREANALGMEVIPMFNHLGHASASREGNGKHVVLDQRPDYEFMFTSYGWVWKYQNEEVYQLLRQIRHELTELCGKGSYFHLGCDEVYSLGSAEKDGLELCRYLNGIEQELEAEGRRGILWGDMLLDKAVYQKEPENYSANGKKEVAAILKTHLSKNILIADWQYWLSGRTWKSAAELKDAGFDVLCCPWHEMHNAKSAIDCVMAEDLYGVMHTTWHTLHRGFPVMVYAGSTSWNGNTNDFSFSEQRIFAAALARKACPANGDYVKAGWSERMTGPGL